MAARRISGPCRSALGATAARRIQPRGRAQLALPREQSRDAFDPDAHDLAALQGTWQQVAFEENGIPDAPDSTGAPGALTVIDGHHFQVRTLGGALLLEGRFMLDASVTPKAITWIDAIGPDAGRPLPASYCLEGDRFVFIAADAGAPRPSVFRTVPGLTMRSFVRYRPAEAGDAGARVAD